MKKITLLMLFVQLLLNDHNAQSPILSVPPNYVQITINGSFSTPLPQPAVPDPNLYNEYIESGFLSDANGSTILAYDGRPAKSTSNTIFGPNGELAAFIIDEYVFDKDGYLLDVITNDDQYFGIGENEIVVIPNPTNCNVFYLVTSFTQSRVYEDTETDNTPTRAGYAILDLTLDRAGRDNPNRIGGLVNLGGFQDYLAPLSPPTNSPQYFFGHDVSKDGNIKYAVTPLNQDKERFLFIEQYGVVQRCIVDENGIYWDNNASDLICSSNICYHFLTSPLAGQSNGKYFGTKGMRRELEIIPLQNGGYKMAFNGQFVQPNVYSDEIIYVIELDQNGVYVQGSEQQLSFRNLSNINLPILERIPLTGLEFSPSGDLLYMTKKINASTPNLPSIYYYDFNNPTLGIQSLGVPNDQEFGDSFIEMGNDGKMYFAAENKLATLSDPENPDANNFTNNAVPIPNFVASTGHFEDNIYSFSIGASAFTLPDQIDGEDWQERFDVVACCEFMSAGIGNYTADIGTQTWSPGNNPFGSASGTVYINGDLTIPIGANIIMNNMKFIFSETSQLNVQIGGKLTTYSTILTSRACEGKMWQGVRVEGNPNLNPIPISNQGYFAMYQNSEINNAYVGVTNYRTTANPNDLANPTPIMAFRGGKVLASNSFYRNNIKDVVLRSYSKPNSSYQFTNCEFVTDDAILDGSDPEYHATLFLVDRVRFHGCDFKNTTTGIYADDDRGSGVYSFNSHFEVSFKCNTASLPGVTCTNKDRSTFSNLYRGVRASGGPFVTKTATVKYSDFDHVSLGVHYTNVDNSFCVNNNFTNIGPLTNVLTAASSSANGAYGLHLDHCTGYAVENNYFESSAYQNDTYGTIVVNSNNNGTIPDANVIYNNEYENLNYGIAGLLENVGISQNGLAEVNSGLQLRCNIFDNIFNDDIAWVRGGISPFQGNCALDELPNNQFHNGSWDLANYNSQLVLNDYKYKTNYLHYPNTNGYYIIPIVINPVVPNTLISNQCAGSFDPIDGCPVHQFDVSKRALLGGKLAGGKSLLIESENLKNEIANADAQALTLMAQRQSNAISVGDYKNAMNTYATLLNDERLVEQLDLNLPHGILKNIMEANAPLSSEVADEIDNATLPNGIKTQLKALKANSNQIPANETVIGDAGYLEIKSKLLINEVIREYLTDTTIINGVDSATLLIEEYNKFYTKCRKVEYYVGKGDYVTAEIVLDSIRDSNNNQDTTLSSFCEFYGLMIEIAQLDETCGIIRTDSLYKQRVESFAEISKTDRTCLRANSLLTAFLDYEYNELFPDFSTFKSMYNPIAEQQEDYTPTKMLLVYPNPSSDIFNILIDDETSTNGSIEVYDNVGKLIVRKQINNSLGYIEMSQFPRGIYQVVVTSQDGNTYFDRIILK